MSPVGLWSESDLARLERIHIVGHGLTGPHFRPKTSHEIFRGACQEFRDALPEEAQKLFIGYGSCAEMIASIEAHCASIPIHGRRLSRCCQAVNRASRRLQPYFDIIGIFCQSHPEYSCLGWGAIRLVFLVSKHKHFRLLSSAL